jgi:hypothetical protein
VVQGTQAATDGFQVDETLERALSEGDIDRVSVNDDVIAGELEDAEKSDSSSSLVEQSTRDVLSAILNWDKLGQPEYGTWLHPRLRIEFKIRSIDNDSWNKMIRDSTDRLKPKKSAQYMAEVNSQKIMVLTILNGTVEPNFADKDFIRAVAAKDPRLDPSKASATDVLYSILLPGEISDLVSEIQAISGINQDEEQQEISDLKGRS